MSSTEIIRARRRAFAQLHKSGCFAIPNPWDPGSAKYLQKLGFQALATTSSGAAWRHGKADGQMNVEEVLVHLQEIVDATDLPVNADFEAGFADDAAGVARNVRRAIATGVAGLSIEDSTGRPGAPLRDLPTSVERIRAARAAIDESGGDTLLVGRAENFLVGHPDLDDVIQRLRAYAAAGADCLYAPGIETREQITAVVAAVAPTPVNLLVWKAGDLTMKDVAALGVRRVSVGGALARTAWGGFMRAAQALASDGTFDGFRGAAAGADLNRLFQVKDAATG
ncbi:MAG: oxaloacetate decarboxylase [Ramlibacter sp.]